jgi:hypothetical protein
LIEDSATGRQGTVLSASPAADAVTALDRDGETTWTVPLSDAAVLDGDIPAPDDDEEPLAWTSELD